MYKILIKSDKLKYKSNMLLGAYWNWSNYERNKGNKGVGILESAYFYSYRIFGSSTKMNTTKLYNFYDHT